MTWRKSCFTFSYILTKIFFFFIWQNTRIPSIYNNHIEQVKEQLTRTPKPLPKMILNPNVKSVFDFKYEDFTLEGYDPYPVIKAQVSV